jgi:hypothetical protein
MKLPFILAAAVLLVTSCSKTDNPQSQPPAGSAQTAPSKLSPQPAEPAGQPPAAAKAAMPADSPPAAPAVASAQPAAQTDASTGGKDPVAASQAASPLPASTMPVPGTLAQATTEAGGATSGSQPAAPPQLSTLEKLERMAAGLTNRISPSTSAPSSVAPSGVSRTTVAVSDLPGDQMTRGLKEALGKGLNRAIAQLGSNGGFLTNAAVRIPMPQKLQAVDAILRRTGQGQLADDFVASLNHAAEKAVPAAAEVFTTSLKQMTIDDARGILQGPKDAATQFFRRTAGPQLQEKFKPIVANATSQVGVTAAYKNLLDKASFASVFLKQESLDLDDYVTGKATDGLFKIVADEEAKIRENPVARTTDLLKSVFGAFQK